MAGATACPYGPVILWPLDSKRLKFFSGTAWYYGDHDFIIQTFNFNARSDTAHVACNT